MTDYIRCLLGSDKIAISGTKRVKYLDENVKALDIKLTASEVEQLSNAIPRDKVLFCKHPYIASLICQCCLCRYPVVCICRPAFPCLREAY